LVCDQKLTGLTPFPLIKVTYEYLVCKWMGDNSICEHERPSLSEKADPRGCFFWANHDGLPVQFLIVHARIAFWSAHLKQIDNSHRKHYADLRKCEAILIFPSVLKITFGGWEFLIF
jgi:hypothetical protein